MDHWSAAAKRNWTDAGYAEAAVLQMMEVLGEVHHSPNLAPQLRLPGYGQIMSIIDAGLGNLTAGQSIEAAADWMQAAAEERLSANYPSVNGTVGYLELYRQQLGYSGSSTTEPEVGRGKWKQRRAGEG